MIVDIYLFILGSAIGSFLGVLIDRLPNEESVNGRSHCDYCKKDLEPIDLIPIFSYLFFKGKCRRCHKKLSWFYPFIEIFTGAIFVLVWLAPIPEFEQFHTWNFWKFVFYNPDVPTMFHSALTSSPFFALYGIYIMKFLLLCIASTLIAIFFADLKYQIIPDSLQAALAIFGLFFLIAKGFTFIQILSAIGAGLFVMTFILALFMFTKGRGIGFGDVKLAFTKGLILGPYAGYLALYLAFISGAIVGVALMASKKKKMKSKIAFGPFMLLGLIVMMWWPDQVLMVIKHFYGIK